jgi:transcriptional regulator with XRE-family HTH domain
MANKDKRAGQRLANLRLRRGLTMQQVRDLSEEVATVRRNPDFLVLPGRLSDIERKGTAPSIYRLYTLSIIYECPLRKLLGFYGLS